MNHPDRQEQGTRYPGDYQYDPESERGDQARNEWQSGGQRSRYDQESGNRNGEAQRVRQPGMGTGSYYGEQAEQPGTGTRGYYGEQVEQTGSRSYGSGDRDYPGGYGRSRGSGGGFEPRGGYRSSEEDSGDWRSYADPVERGGTGTRFGYQYSDGPRYDTGRRGEYPGEYGSRGVEGRGSEGRPRGQERFRGYRPDGEFDQNQYRRGGGAWDWEGWRDYGDRGRGDYSERDYAYMADADREWGRRGWDRGERGDDRADRDRFTSRGPGARDEGWRRPYQGSGFGVLGGYDKPRGYGELGESHEGPYSGRGPRGYKRSDERICEEVCERLMHLGQVDASDIDVSVDKGEVMLKGTVRDRWQKRMAEDCVESVWGVRDVNNKLKIEGGNGGNWRPEDNERSRADAEPERKPASDAFDTPGTQHGSTAGASRPGATTGATSPGSIANQVPEEGTVAVAER